MNHPKREEWIPLLCGEADTGTKDRLEAHLESCAECAAQVKAWRRSLGRLDAWRLPDARVADARRSLPPVAWAAAAAIFIAAFLAGRITAPAFDAQKFRAELKSELSSEVQHGFARIDAQSSKALADAEERLLAAWTRGNQQFAADFVSALNTIRAEDRRATEALLSKLQEQHTRDFVLLRKDLETVASFTDEEFRNARLKLYEIAAAQHFQQP